MNTFLIVVTVALTVIILIPPVSPYFVATVIAAWAIFITVCFVNRCRQCKKILPTWRMTRHIGIMNLTSYECAHCEQQRRESETVRIGRNRDLARQADLYRERLANDLQRRGFHVVRVSTSQDVDYARLQADNVCVIAAVTVVERHIWEYCRRQGLRTSRKPGEVLDALLAVSQGSQPWHFTCELYQLAGGQLEEFPANYEDLISAAQKGADAFMLADHAGVDSLLAHLSE